MIKILTNDINTLSMLALFIGLGIFAIGLKVLEKEKIETKIYNQKYEILSAFNENKILAYHNIGIYKVEGWQCLDLGFRKGDQIVILTPDFLENVKILKKDDV